MEMPFGKHKGKEIEDIPRSYLEWLWENVDLNPRLSDEVADVLGEEPKPRPERRPRPVALPAPDIKQITPCYRRMALKYHPDTGGSHEAMQAINDFYENIRKVIEG